MPARVPLRHGRALAFALAVLGSSQAAGCGPGTRGADDAPASATSPVARAALPEFAPGTSRSAIVTALAGWAPAHPFSAPGVVPEGWEWSGPDGGRVEAWFTGEHTNVVQVSRTWGTGAPPVDGRQLPDRFVGASLEALEADVGAGLLVSRGWSDMAGLAPAGVREEYRWAIHDRGVDTGLFLQVLAGDGRVLAVHHPWSRK